MVFPNPGISTATPTVVPILHFPQLLGLAFGLDPKTLGLPRHMVDPSVLLNKVTMVSTPA